MEELRVNLGERSYPIYIGYYTLKDLCKNLKKIIPQGKVALITNIPIAKIYLETVKTGLEKEGYEVLEIKIPEGERYKSLGGAKKIYDRLVDFSLERVSPIISLGGGVIGDLSGFVAATFLRGVPWIQVPTTLLAQVDSSVGGKTAVNHPKGKNLIGAFYQPRLVFIDIATLKTLERREFLAGMAEVVKYGIITNEGLFRFLERSISQILALDEESLSAIVKRSLTIKAEIVERDEREAGLRSILNLGHTLGHAIEAISGYTTYRHGEAIAIGMVGAAKISANLGICKKGVFEQIEQLLQRIGLPTDLPFQGKDLIPFMEVDKKVVSGKVRFILIEEIGKVRISPLRPEEIVDLLS